MMECCVLWLWRQKHEHFTNKERFDKNGVNKAVCRQRESSAWWFFLPYSLYKTNQTFYMCVFNLFIKKIKKILKNPNTLLCIMIFLDTWYWSWRKALLSVSVCITWNETKVYWWVGVLNLQTDRLGTSWHAGHRDSLLYLLLLSAPVVGNKWWTWWTSLIWTLLPIFSWKHPVVNILNG